MKRLWNHPLGREILVILGVKFALLFVLWWAFFSGPVASHQLSPEQVSHALLASPPTPDTHKE